jgi:hypothetical protein
MHVYDLIGVLMNAEKKLLKYGELEEKLIDPEKLEEVLESLAAAGVSPPVDLKTLVTADETEERHD